MYEMSREGNRTETNKTKSDRWLPGAGVGWVVTANYHGVSLGGDKCSRIRYW